MRAASSRVGSNRTQSALRLVVLKPITTVRTLRRGICRVPLVNLPHCFRRLRRAAVPVLWAVPGLPVRARVPQPFCSKCHLLLLLQLPGSGPVTPNHRSSGPGFPTSSLATGEHSGRRHLAVTHWGFTLSQPQLPFSSLGSRDPGTFLPLKSLGSFVLQKDAPCHSATSFLRPKLV